MVTLLCALLDARQGVLRMASAGHCPPIVRSASGHVTRVDVDPSPPLGAGLVHPGQAPVETVVPFGAGDVVVLYTDGLVERRHVSIDVVLDAVERVVSRHREPAALCTHLADFAATDRDHDDDLALLVVRRHDERADQPEPATPPKRVASPVERV